MEAVIVFIIFGTIFGMVYLYFSTRNKERLALIEKGADASIFVKGKTQAAPIWKILILNVALLLIGVGAGIFISGLLIMAGIDEDFAQPGAILMTAGIALFIGFNLTKSLDKE